jgi:hypothetical protein
MLTKRKVVHWLTGDARFNDELAEHFYRALKAAEEMYGRYCQAVKDEEYARRQHRCCGSYYMDQKGYVYANHGIHDDCPMHGRHPKYPGEKRLRKYLGHHSSDEAGYLKIAIKQWEAWQTAVQQVERMRLVYFATLGVVDQAADTANEKHARIYY